MNCHKNQILTHKIQTDEKNYLFVFGSIYNKLFNFR